VTILILLKKKDRKEIKRKEKYKIGKIDLKEMLISILRKIQRLNLLNLIN